MKSIASLLVISALLTLGVLAQEDAPKAPAKIPASAAKAHVGSKAVVTGKVAEVNLGEKLVRINFDEPFPKQTFTAVIFAPQTNLFPEVAKLKGQTIEVSGTITEYRERPQIKLTATNQVKVVAVPEPEKK